MGRRKWCKYIRISKNKINNLLIANFIIQVMRRIINVPL